MQVCEFGNLSFSDFEWPLKYGFLLIALFFWAIMIVWTFKKI